ncbi:hypothetical protein D915_006480 [Fasciola hepatica]|uniref:Uncharacterized protein n=1 Tax=Fasciola hepatica TaxID=6192 RepID=A0A4E0RQ04_FASHE|nr:hypothetical protein D915_006480 [Fasciola hepatica]
MILRIQTNRQSRYELALATRAKSCLKGSALRVVVGRVVGDDGQCATTSDCKAEVLKCHFGWVHTVNLGDYINRNSNQATTQMGDFLIYPDQVAEATKMLSASKAAGSDGLHPTIFKPLESNMAESLTQLFNMTLETATLPLDWKIAEVVPIHKGGSKEDAENYRPLSLLSVILKVFEKILRNEMWNSVPN